MNIFDDGSVMVLKFKSLSTSQFSCTKD